MHRAYRPSFHGAPPLTSWLAASSGRIVALSSSDLPWHGVACLELGFLQGSLIRDMETKAEDVCDKIIVDALDLWDLVQPARAALWF